MPTILTGAELHQDRRAEHIMGMPAQSRKRWTAREVRDLIARAPRVAPRYELVDGELLVTPSPAWQHQEIVASLASALRAYLAAEPVGHALFSPSDIELEPEDIRQPDIYVMPLDEWSRVRREQFPVRRLLLAVEVLSPSSLRMDRDIKRPGYQRYVPEYWIVDPDARHVERWRPGRTEPDVLTEQLTWKPEGAASPFRLPLQPFFAAVWGE